MSKALNITLNILCGLIILYIFAHGIWNVGSFDPHISGELKSAQIFEGYFAIAVGIGLLLIYIQLKRKQIENTTANLAGLNRIPVRFEDIKKNNLAQRIDNTSFFVLF